MSGLSNLERVLRSGRFAVTAECGPPRGADGDMIRKKGEIIKDYVDAVNVTDNQTAVVRMSSLASSIILKDMGIEPVMQMVCRDRNRIAIQSDILGAAVLGIKNILCLSGDHQRFGDHKTAKNVFDLDSVQLINCLKTMRDKGRFLSGEEIKAKPIIFIGCVENPFADPFEIRAMRLAKKANAGAQFCQTQCVFNIKRFKEWMEIIRDMGIHENIGILAGVTPLRSYGMAIYMKNNVPGMDVPDEIIERLKAVPKEKASDEGINIALEIIEEMKNIKGVKGIHIMAIGWEEIIPHIVKSAGLYPRT